MKPKLKFIPRRKNSILSTSCKAGQKNSQYLNWIKFLKPGHKFSFKVTAKRFKCHSSIHQEELLRPIMKANENKYNLKHKSTELKQSRICSDICDELLIKVKQKMIVPSSNLISKVHTLPRNITFKTIDGGNIWITT